MARGVQITIVMSMWGRCRFVESLNSITIGIFFENEEIRLYILHYCWTTISIYFLKILSWVKGLAIFKYPGTAGKSSEFGHVEIVKQIKQSPNFLRNHNNIFFISVRLVTWPSDQRKSHVHVIISFALRQALRVQILVNIFVNIAFAAEIFM